MAKIFVSHSQKDEEIKSFFEKVFLGATVQPVFEEIEKIVKGQVTRDDIIQGIISSRAVFVLLSQNAEQVRHTRDWILFECGTSHNKDVWVFEPYSEYGKISIIVPSLRHYVVFAQNESWFKYIRRIVESYDDSQVLATTLLTSGIGALIGAAVSKKDRVAGAVAGGFGGAVLGSALADKSYIRPTGLPLECTKCKSIYSIHIPIGVSVIRCPVCNESLSIVPSNYKITNRKMSS